MINLHFVFIIILLLLTSCSKEQVEISNIKEIRQDLEMISAYKEAYKSLEEGDPYFAAQKFLESELLFPQSQWASKSALMASYSYYLQNYYEEALSNLDRFLQTYPKSKDIVYAHYLIAMCFYETIEDEKRDNQPILKAKDKFEFIIKNYPNTDFAIDSKFKLNLIKDIQAAKEMYIARHYQKKEKWIASINRFKNVIEFHDETIFVEEALHRLVELYYKIGLIEESQKYANVLGYNYLSSEWYKKSYKIFNKNYSSEVIENYNKDMKNKKGIARKFKRLFD
jgi:outer membrane protein assembly factor BamD